MSEDNVVDIGKAGLAALKKRQAKGKLELKIYHPDSPMIKAAQGDPEMLVIDVDWVETIWRSLPEHRVEFLKQTAEMGAMVQFGELTPISRAAALVSLLRYAEANGDLAKWQQEDSDHAQ